MLAGFISFLTDSQQSIGGKDLKTSVIPRYGQRMSSIHTLHFFIFRTCILPPQQPFPNQKGELKFLEASNVPILLQPKVQGLTLVSVFVGMVRVIQLSHHNGTQCGVLLDALMVPV
ncbi:hypothetical protein JD844_004926 [Phrynosoma platyrhinos]|uniref:Uncharacterized protein n=1 Tax=Phrynosoma platyrhinos TaxID=52577 RepID=A0ABQ7SDX4_PHRPL|nr:hypothetical protein JD844_004926 [Phrynosoma platyrhinos]